MDLLQALARIAQRAQGPPVFGQPAVRSVEQEDYEDDGDVVYEEALTAAQQSDLRIKQAYIEGKVIDVDASTEDEGDMGDMDEVEEGDVGERGVGEGDMVVDKDSSMIKPEKK